MNAKNSEVLMNTQAVISCIIFGLGEALDKIEWETTKSAGVIHHGTDGYEIDEGLFDNETNSQTTVLTIPADKNTADTVYTCVITAVKHAVVAHRTSVISDVLSKLSYVLLIKSFIFF